MSRAGRCMLTVWITMGIATAASAQDAFRVPVRDVVYEELEHFRALGAWSGGFDMRPVLRSEVLAVLDSLSLRREALDPMDRDRLDRLLERTAPWRRAQESAPVRAGRPASYFEVGGGLQFFGGPSDLADVTLVSRRPRLEYLYVGSLRAEVATRWTADLRIYGDYGRFTSRPNRHDWVDNLPTGLDRLTIDPSIRLDRAVIGYAGDWAEVRFGREDRRWGVGRRGGLFLTDNPFPLDGLSLRVRTGVFTATSLFAQSQRGPNPPSVIPGEPFPPTRARRTSRERRTWPCTGSASGSRSGWTWDSTRRSRTAVAASISATRIPSGCFWP